MSLILIEGATSKVCVAHQGTVLGNGQCSRSTRLQICPLHTYVAWSSGPNLTITVNESINLPSKIQC